MSGDEETGFIGELGEKIGKPIFGFNIFNLEDFVEEWLGEWGVSRALSLSIIFCGLLGILWLEIPDLPLFAFEWLLGTAAIWVPVCLFIAAWHVWVWYVQSLFLAGRNPVLLEMKIPRDIFKSPRAMEVALSNLWLSSGETTFLHRGWKGQVRPIFALEIASFGGEIHFFIWCWKNYKDLVEAAIYGQYPEVELYEVEDYASKFKWDPAIYNCFATDWRLEPPSKFGFYGKGHFPRVEAYPIKTYVDFELDKDPKEEFKVEPLGTILELMGSIKPDEQIWAQFVIRRCGKYGVLSTHERDDEWRTMVKEEVDKVRTQAAIIPSKALKAVLHDLGDEDAPERTPQARASWRQQRMMETMERNLGKLPFEFVGHGVYLTKGEMRGPYYTSTRWLWKALGNPSYMSHLRPRRWHNPFDYPWQDWNDMRWNHHAKRFFDAYRRRSAFHTPWIFPSNVVTTEVLATLWHPPSRTVAVPGLERIPATKAEPPANLPK